MDRETRLAVQLVNRVVMTIVLLYFPRKSKAANAMTAIHKRIINA
jgi:hypothetical protein